MVEQRSPKPQVGGSSPSWPASPAVLNKIKILMNSQSEETSSLVDVVKQVSSLILAIAGLVAFYQFSDVLLLYRVLGLVAVVLIAFFIFFTTAKGRSAWLFAIESKYEFRRVVWPSKDETVKTTLLVFAMVLLVGVILWLLDTFLFWAIQFLMGKGAG